MKDIIKVETGGVCGFYKLRKGIINPDGSETITGETDWFPNLITDAGLNLMAVGDSNASDPLRSCQVGTGNTIPANGDTTLASWLAGTSSDSPSGTGQGEGAVTGPPAYGWRRVAKRFGAGAAAGNLAEIGMAVGTTTASPLFSRALILDGGGSPTTLTILPIEFLDVLYELRHYPKTTDTVVSGTIEGVTYTITIRPLSFWTSYFWYSGIGNLSYIFASINGEMRASEGNLPALGGTASSTVSGGSAPQTYVSGSYQRIFQGIWGIGSANFATGIGTVHIDTAMGQWGFGFSPKIPKDNTKQLTLRLGISWGRHTP